MNLLVYIPVSDYHTILFSWIPNMIALMSDCWQQTIMTQSKISSFSLSEILPSLDRTGGLHYWANPEVVALYSVVINIISTFTSLVSSVLCLDVHSCYIWLHYVSNLHIAASPNPLMCVTRYYKLLMHVIWVSVSKPNTSKSTSILYLYVLDILYQLPGV